MGRERRSFDRDTPYHVVGKGNNGEAIVRDVVDRELFTSRLAHVAMKYDWDVYAWCLMRNHLHVILSSEGDAISAGVQELFGGHARMMNRRHGRSGHLFRNRFFSRIVQTEAHAVASIAYVNRNPVRHLACRTAEDWPDSSYRATIGLAPVEEWLAVSAALRFFGSDTAAARASLAWHVASGHVPVSDTITEVQRFEDELGPEVPGGPALALKRG